MNTCACTYMCVCVYVSLYYIRTDKKQVIIGVTMELGREGTPKGFRLEESPGFLRHEAGI